jgi:hypothetical protein
VAVTRSTFERTGGTDAGDGTLGKRSLRLGGYPSTLKSSLPSPLRRAASHSSKVSGSPSMTGYAVLTSDAGRLRAHRRFLLLIYATAVVYFFYAPYRLLAALLFACK